LKGLSFKIEKICFDVRYGFIPRHWRLLGSNDGHTWTKLHDQGNDPRCNTRKPFIVYYDIQSSDFFTLFKFEQLDKNYNNYNFCSFFSVEFIGRLNSSPIELFKHLRQQCNNQNPHKAGLVNLTASSICTSTYVPCNIFEYSRNTCWNSKDEQNQWLLFDLKGLSFKIEKICFGVSYGRISRHWRLLGSNDDQTWVTIHDQGNDERCKAGGHFVVDYDIQSSDFFTLFKFEELDYTYNNNHRCAFYSVEFIGRLNSK
jgi:hypothetical protein